MHNMQMMISNHRGKASPTFEARKDKGNFKKNSKSSKSAIKESMSVTMIKPIRISGKSRVEEKLSSGKEVLIPDSDLLGMLDDLLEKGIIELPPSKRPEEAGMVNDPKYYRYHMVISHPLEKCIMLKDHIMQLA